MSRMRCCRSSDGCAVPVSCVTSRDHSGVHVGMHRVMAATAPGTCVGSLTGWWWRPQGDRTSSNCISNEHDGRLAFSAEMQYAW